MASSCEIGEETANLAVSLRVVLAILELAVLANDKQLDAVRPVLWHYVTLSLKSLIEDPANGVLGNFSSYTSSSQSSHLRT